MAAPDIATLYGLGAVGYVIIVLFYFIVVLYNALILWLVSKVFKLHNTKFKAAFITALVAGVINSVVRVVLGILLGGAAGAAGAAAATEASVAVRLLTMLFGLAAMFLVNSLTAKKFYKLETGKSFLIGLVWTVAAIIAGIAVGLVMGAILLAIVLATAPAVNA